MKYNPEKHKRHSLRLKEYDYSETGGYFITICTINKSLIFEEYPELKRITECEWKNIQNRDENIRLDEFVIMPNHFHGIVFINPLHAKTQNVGVTLAVTQNKDPKNHNPEKNNVAVTQDKNMRAGASPAPTRLGDIVGSFKSLCAHRWLHYINENKLNISAKIWQRNYYDHVIRNERELKHIRQYIVNNPLKWEFDRENELSKYYDLNHDVYFRGVYEN